MAMPPKFIHPVRRVRELVGKIEGKVLTQAQFGRRLGCSGSYIQRIELGQVHAPDVLCRKIAILTGVDFRTLKNKSAKPLMDEDGKPATVEALRKFKQFRDSQRYHLLGLFALKHAETSLVSAGLAARGSRYCIDALLMSFSAWLNDAIAEFGLKEAFTREMKDRAAKWNDTMEKNAELLYVHADTHHWSFAGGAIAAIKAFKDPRPKGSVEEFSASLGRAFDRGIAD